MASATRNDWEEIAKELEEDAERTRAISYSDAETYAEAAMALRKGDSKQAIAKINQDLKDLDRLIADPTLASLMPIFQMARRHMLEAIATLRVH